MKNNLYFYIINMVEIYKIKRDKKTGFLNIPNKLLSGLVTSQFKLENIYEYQKSLSTYKLFMVPKDCSERYIRFTIEFHGKIKDIETNITNINIDELLEKIINELINKIKNITKNNNMRLYSFPKLTNQIMKFDYKEIEKCYGHRKLAILPERELEELYKDDIFKFDFKGGVEYIDDAKSNLTFNTSTGRLNIEIVFGSDKYNGDIDFDEHDSWNEIFNLTDAEISNEGADEIYNSPECCAVYALCNQLTRYLKKVRKMSK